MRDFLSDLRSLREQRASGQAPSGGGGVLAGLPGLSREDFDAAEARIQEPVGFVEGLLPESVGSSIPFVRHGLRYRERLELARNARALEEGRGGRAESLAILNELAEQGRPRTFLGGVGEIAAEAIGTGVELAIPGGAIGRAGKAAAALGATRQGVVGAALRAFGTRVGQGVATLGVAAPAAREAIPRLVGLGGGAASAAAVQRSMPGLALTTDDAGKVALALEHSFADFLDAPLPLWKGVVDELISLGVEGSGGAIGKLPLFAQLRGIQASLAQRFIQREGVQRFLAKTAERGFYSDALTEVAEERLDTLLKAGVPGFEERLEDVFPGARQLAQEFVAMSAIGGAGVTGGIAAEAGLERREKRAREAVAGALGETEQAVVTPTPEGGDPSSGAPEAVPVAEGAPTFTERTPEERAADVEAYRAALGATGDGAVPDVAEAQPTTRGELAVQAFMRARGIDPTFVEGGAPDATGFFPGPGRAVVQRGEAAYDAGFHETVHEFVARQTPEAVAALEAEVEAIDPGFLERVAAFRAEAARIETPELAREEALATGAQAVATLARYLRTEQGAQDFARVFEQQPGVLRRVGETILDAVGTLVPGLRVSQRTAARDRIAAVRTALADPAAAPRLARAFNQALDSLLPALETRASAEDIARAKQAAYFGVGTWQRGPAPRSTGSRVDPVTGVRSPLGGRSVQVDAETSPKDRPNIAAEFAANPQPEAQESGSVPKAEVATDATQPTGIAGDITAEAPAPRPVLTREEREAERERRRAEARLAATPLPGDIVRVNRAGPDFVGEGGRPSVVTGPVEAEVLEVTGSGANVRLKVRVLSDLVRAGEQTRAASRNRARRAEAVQIVPRNEVVLIRRGEVDPTSKRAKERARSVAALRATVPAARAAEPPPPLAAKLAAKPTTVVEAATVEALAAVDIRAALKRAAKAQSHFMGNKREFINNNIDLLTRAIKSLPAEADTIYDMYAGGGTYGLSLAATGAVPRVKRVVVNEVDPTRATKTARAMKEGGAFLDEWKTNPTLVELKGALWNTLTNAVSNSPAALALDVARGVTESKAHAAFATFRNRLAALPQRAKDAVMAVADVAFSTRGNSDATNTPQRKRATFEALFDNAQHDAQQLHELASAAAARGVAVQMTSYDSVSAEAVAFMRSQPPGLLLLDPPYHEAASGTYSVGDKVYQFASDEFLRLTLEAGVNMVEGKVALYHNKATSGSVPAVRSAFAGHITKQWTRAQGQGELVSFIDGTKQDRSAGRGRGNAVRGVRPVDSGDPGQATVLEKPGRPRRGDAAARGARPRAAGAGPASADAGQGVAPRFAPSLRSVLPAVPAHQRPQLASAVDWLRLRLQDDTVPIRQFPELREAVKGARAKAPARVERFQQEVDRLIAPFRKSPANLQDVQRALYYAAAVERNAWMLAERDVEDGSGVSTAEASRKLGEIKSRVGADLIDTFLAGIARLNRERLDHLVETRMVEPEKADRWHRREPHWTSLRDLDPEKDTHTGFETSGRSTQVKNPQFRKAKGRESEVDNALLAWFTETTARMMAAEKNRAMHVGFKLAQDGLPGIRSHVKPTGVPGGFTPPPEYVAFVDGGKQMYLEFASPDAAAALKALNGVQAGFLLNGLGRLTRLFSRNVTGRNPFFWVPNFLRDTTQALWTIGAERSVRQGAQVFGRAWASLPGVLRYQLTGDTAAVPYMEAAKRAGFKTTWTGRQTLSELLQEFKTKIEGPTTVRAKVQATLAWLERVGESFELATRYAAFAHEFEKKKASGVSDAVAEDRAGAFARELTINFDTRGTWTPALSSLYAFFNPAVQGSARLAKAALSGPRGGAAVAALVTLGAIMEAIGYAMADEDEETGLNEYGNLAEWEKSRNIVIPIKVGGVFPKVTLPYGIDAIFGMGRRLIHFASDGGIDPRITRWKALQEGVLHAGSAFNPLGEISDPFAMATPTVFRPLTEIERNVKFGDRPIQKPKSSFGQELPDSARAFGTIDDRASGWLALRIADVLNFGGPEELPTGFDVSPESVQHLIEFGLSSFGLRAVDQLSEFALSKRPVTPSAVVPILKNFSAAVTDHYVSELYYGIRNRASTLRGMASRAESAENVARIRNEDPVAFDLAERVAAIDRRLSKINAQLRRSNLTPAEVREQRDRLTSWQARVVRAYYEAQK